MPSSTPASAAPRPRSGALRCSARQRRYRRRCCRNCPARRRADNGAKKAGRGGPARRTARDCRADGICPSRRRRCARISCKVSCCALARLPPTPRGIEPEQPHPPQDPAMDRLQSVADVGKRSRSDGRERIDQIALRKRRVERRVDGGGGQIVGLHERRLARPSPRASAEMMGSRIFTHARPAIPSKIGIFRSILGCFEYFMPARPRILPKITIENWKPARLNAYPCPLFAAGRAPSAHGSGRSASACSISTSSHSRKRLTLGTIRRSVG